MKNTHNEIWIVLIGLYPSQTNTIINQNQGAYANILLIARDLEDYKRKAISFLSKMNFDVFEMEDIERFDKRIQNYEVDSTIMVLAKSVQIQQIPHISTLHVFDREDFVKKNMT